MEYIQIGTIVNTFGLQGELKVLSNSEFAEERFAVGSKIYVFKADKYLPCVIESFRVHGGNILISLQDFATINDVLPLKSCPVFVRKDEIAPLEDGYYLFQLQGMTVYHDNNSIGTVVAAEKFSAQTVLRVADSEKTVLIPFVPAFIVDVDLEKKRIDIRVIEGLL